MEDGDHKVYRSYGYSSDGDGSYSYGWGHEDVKKTGERFATYSNEFNYAGEGATGLAQKK